MDKQIGRAIADGLRQAGINVTTTSEVGLRAASDKEQIAFALSQERVIFTQDDDFLKLHAQGIEHAGIVYCRQNTRSIGEIVTWLVLIWEVMTPEEMQSRIEVL